jgi:lysophospholipase L1-like esterase
MCAWIACLALLLQEIPAEWRSAAIEFETDVQALEALDRHEPDPAGAVLLFGSSSFRLWESAADDLAPWPIVRRGFGGARFSDMLVYAPRLIPQHNFAALVLFSANDIRGKEDDKSPEQVVDVVRRLIDVVRQSHPIQPIFVVAITPTRARWSVWPQIADANQQLAKLCERLPQVHFIPTAEHYLTCDGQPRDELFIDDELHQNRDGYRQWGRLISGALERHGVLHP